MLKQEEEGAFPPEAYAIVGDKDNPASWKVRLWDAVRLRITMNQLISLYELLPLSRMPGPWKLSDEELKLVLRRLREEAARLGHKL